MRCMSSQNTKKRNHSLFSILKSSHFFKCRLLSNAPFVSRMSNHHIIISHNQHHITLLKWSLLRIYAVTKCLNVSITLKLSGVTGRRWEIGVIHNRLVSSRLSIKSSHRECWTLSQTYGYISIVSHFVLSSVSDQTVQQTGNTLT